MKLLSSVIEGLLIFAIPIAVVWALFAVVEGTSTPNTNPLAMVLVVLGWIGLLTMTFRREWKHR